MPWSHRPVPPQSPKRRTGLLIAIAAGVAVLAGAAGVAGALLAPSSPPAAQQPAAGTSGTPGPLTPTTAATEAAAVAPADVRVTALMSQAGCPGKIVGTQLYARETGRCTLGRTEVTVATFTDDQLRDQWVSAAKQYGGTFVVGDRWAAMADSPDAARVLADKLDGRRV